MREVVLDTETTGLEAHEGDRIIEIGGVELINHIPSGKSFHVHINPECEISQGAFAIHGLSTEFLSEKPVFAEIADDFIAFIADSPLIIHNAEFDANFLNSEFERLGRRKIPRKRLIDTLYIARQRHPKGPNSLDALCRRYNVDNSGREKHGALLDAELLAELYIDLIGAREPHLTLVTEASTPAMAERGVRARPQPLPERISQAEREAHKLFVEELGAAAIWNDYPEWRRP